MLYFWQIWIGCGCRRRGCRSPLPSPQYPAGVCHQCWGRAAAAYTVRPCCRKQKHKDLPVRFEKCGNIRYFLSFLSGLIWLTSSCDLHWKHKLSIYDCWVEKTNMQMQNNWKKNLISIDYQCLSTYRKCWCRHLQERKIRAAATLVSPAHNECSNHVLSLYINSLHVCGGNISLIN